MYTVVDVTRGMAMTQHKSFSPSAATALDGIIFSANKAAKERSSFSYKSSSTKSLYNIHTVIVK
jgi:hypothetical protein